MSRTRLEHMGNYSLIKEEHDDDRYESVFYIVLNHLTEEETVFEGAYEAYSYLKFCNASPNAEMD